MFVNSKHVCIFGSDLKQITKTMSKQDKKTAEPESTGLPYEVIGALADRFKKSPLTIQRWVEARDDRLTSDKAREVFAEKNVTWS